MTATALEPETDLDSARAVPFVTVGWAALTAWAGWRSQQSDWQPLWFRPALTVVMVAGLVLLIVLSVQGLRQRRALRRVTATLDPPFLTVGEPARLGVQTGADPHATLAVDAHLEGREYTRKFVAKNLASGSGGGWREKAQLVHRSHACTAFAAEGARLDNLHVVVPADIHPSVTDKPHGIDWTLRIRIKAGTAPTWDAKYPVTIRGRNGSGININSKQQSFQLPKVPDEPLPGLPQGWPTE